MVIICNINLFLVLCKLIDTFLLFLRINSTSKIMTTYPERAKLEKFMIMNFLEITEMIGDENERILSIFKDLRKELDAGRIRNNMVVASDDQDTQWLFDIYSYDKEEDFYYLEYTGTAK